MFREESTLYCLLLVATLFVVAGGCASTGQAVVHQDQPAVETDNQFPTSPGGLKRDSTPPAEARAKPVIVAPASHVDQPQNSLEPEVLPSPHLLPRPEQPGSDRYPIDLPTALQLAGANNLQIALAGERIRQAQARLEGAEHQWLPSIQAGVGYNFHDGRVQGTEGEVIDTRRNAVFVGGGPNIGPGPLTGPGGPPARLFLGLPLADVLFAPLAERQQAQAASAASAATFNDTLLQAALAYLQLVQAQGQVAIAQQAVTNAEELLRLVESRVNAGTAPPADGLRAKIELAERRRQTLVAEEFVRVASADLARLLRLDPVVTLFPVEGEPTVVCMIDQETPLPELLSEGLTIRPELAQHRALVNSTVERMRQELWRPWLPTVQVGLSAGGFGGGIGSTADNFGGRTDFDALMVWELRNLGLGNRALQRERISQHAQAGLQAEQLLDAIAAEIVAAYYQVQLRQQQVDQARAAVESAAEAVPLNFKGILGGDPAASLLAAVAGIDPCVTSGTSGRLLDDQAMAKYKQRYTELQEELEEAESSNDLGSIAKVQAEMEAFGTEIARATGLGGKKRERTDAEKVRKAVSMAVSRAIDSIRNEHAILGRHLQNSVSPGLTFRYDPEHAPGWLT